MAGARKLITRGETVTVAAAAAEMGISRATAYRYFSDPSVMAAEAGLAIEVWPYERVIGKARTLRDKLKAISLYFFDLAAGHEAGFRVFLARNLDASLASNRPDQSLRGGRRVAMYLKAFEDSDESVSDDTKRRIVMALSMTTGIEALISLYDIAGADRQMARRTVDETAALIIEHHLDT